MSETSAKSEHQKCWLSITWPSVRLPAVPHFSASDILHTGDLCASNRLFTRLSSLSLPLFDCTHIWTVAHRKRKTHTGWAHFAMSSECACEELPITWHRTGAEKRSLRRNCSVNTRHRLLPCCLCIYVLRFYWATCRHGQSADRQMLEQGARESLPLPFSNCLVIDWSSRHHWQIQLLTLLKRSQNERKICTL